MAPQMRGSRRPFRAANSAGLWPVAAAPRPGRGAPGAAYTPSGGSALIYGRERLRGPGGRPPAVGACSPPGACRAPHPCDPGSRSRPRRGRAQPHPPSPAESPPPAQATWPCAKPAPSPRAVLSAGKLRMVFPYLNGWGGEGWNVSYELRQL